MIEYICQSSAESINGYTGESFDDVSQCHHVKFVKYRKECVEAVESEFSGLDPLKYSGTPDREFS